MNTTTRTQAAPTHPSELALGIAGFTFLDLHSPERLADLHRVFLDGMAAEAPALHARWTRHADGCERLSGPAESTILIEVSRHVSAFVARLFRVESVVSSRRETLTDRLIVYRVRDRFVKKVVKRVALAEGSNPIDVHARAARLLDALPGRKGREIDAEERFAMRVWNLLERAADEKAAIGLDETVAQALETIALSFKLRAEAHDPSLAGWRMLRKPHELDWEHGLVHHIRPIESLPEAIEGAPKLFRRRDGFKLTDRRANDALTMNEIDQCIFCHEREKDSCSKGLLDKKTAKVAKNPLGIALDGCPLDEHISEMHALYAEGDPIGALALVTINNAMCPGTGHRICNDCMKACIYQKQEPVNIPQVETKVLSDVLEMPWGPEIWLLTTRWNPLRVERPFALPYNGINVLVVGMGPSGYTLAHYLTQEGFGVVALDGLKVEPLPGSVTGRLGKSGPDIPPSAVEAWKSLAGELDERVLLGFGGVSEYGITVRWDKNFLTLPYLSLMRRENFDLHGGVRFGGALDLDDAWRLGFDHVAIATGAGKPTIVDMKNNLARGVRKASDFLMALQLTGAFKKDSLACLQLRLPVVVIGGGLTGVDTATESLAYYPVQVEKMATRYDVLRERFGEDNVRRFFNEEERHHLDEFVAHGRAVLAERERARNCGEEPDFVTLVRSFGGVRLVYRKTMADSPAYRLNHEEVQKALEEGITFVECMSPTEILLDRHGAVRGIRFERQKHTADGKWIATGEFVEMAAGTVLVAAGTSPNITYEREKPGTFALDERKSFFQVGRVDGDSFAPVKRGRDDRGAAFLTSYVQGTRTVSVYGDNHAAYAGNVVKAMASARDGYTSVVEVFRERIAHVSNATDAIASRRGDWKKLLQRLDFELVAVVHEVNRLTPTITEIVVHAPAAARRFEPGQFYRLQNFEAYSTRPEGTTLSMEGLALTGAWVDRERGLVSTIVLEMGGSSDLCAVLEPGEPVVLMGPTGTATETPGGETAALVGGGLGNAVLFSIGAALREAGSRVLYFAGYKKLQDRYKVAEIEAAADEVVWCCDEAPGFPPTRAGDKTFVGNIVEAMAAHASGALGQASVALQDADRIIAIGSDGMMAAVARARHGVLQPYVKRGHVAIGSINSPMQCMMKEICAQCLQPQVDPATGRTRYVFSCFNQDQPLDEVDFQGLRQRLGQNSLQEKLTAQWVDRSLVIEGIRPAR